MRSLKCFLICFLTTSVISQSLMEDENSNCTLVEVTKKQEMAYIGWPYQIDCMMIAENSPQGFEEDAETQCRIWDRNGTLLLNTSFMDYESLEDAYDNGQSLFLPEVQEGDNTDFHMFLFIPSEKQCLVINFHLNLIKFKQLTCQEFVETRTIFSIPSELDDKRNFRCQLSSELYPKIHSESDVTYKWLHNCSELPQNVSVRSNNLLSINSVDYNQAGIYMCTATYNGMTRYLNLYEICVQQPFVHTQQSIICSKPTLHSSLGDDAIFECVSDFGVGQPLETDFSISWKKNEVYANVTYCVSSLYGKQESSNIECLYMYEASCYLRDTTEEERKKKKAIVPVQFIIKNVQKQDYGSYVLMTENNYEKSKIINITLILQPENVSGLYTKAQVAGFSVGLFIFLILLLLVIRHFQIYIRVYYKRSFGKSQPDDKLYGAYLVYNYSSDNDKFAKEEVKTAVFAVTRVLTNLRYTVYDEQKEGFIQAAHKDNINESIEKSHRIIIFMTLDFIKDDWSMLALQKGFERMLQTNSKLIFILFPGIKEYVKQHSKKDDVCRMIRRAVELNNAIEWSQKKHFDHKTFKLKLEDAMPKLKSQKTSRLLLSQSDDQVTLREFNGNAA